MSFPLMRNKNKKLRRSNKKISEVLNLQRKAQISWGGLIAYKSAISKLFNITEEATERDIHSLHHIR